MINNWRFSSINSPECDTATKIYSVTDFYRTLICTRYTACFAFTEYIFFVEVSFIKRKRGHFFFFLVIYFKWSRQARECVLSFVSPGDSGQFYEQCLLCRLIDEVFLSQIVQLLLSHMIMSFITHGNQASQYQFSSWHPPIITVLCPNICPQ